MGTDVGKLAKRMGRVHPKNVRKVDVDPARLPPHKKPRVYILTAEWVETQTISRTAKFTSKDARERSKLRIQREVKEQKWLSWTGWHEQRNFRIKEGPTFTEELRDS